MTIKELLKAEAQPWAWVQGHHTRILLSEALDKSIFYKVLSQENGRKMGGRKGSYLRKCYEGHEEEAAVAAFIKSEEE